MTVDRTTAAYRAAAAVARTLPAGLVDRAGEALGAAATLVTPVRRQLMARNIERAHGRALAPAELRRSVRRAYATYGRYWAESFRLPGASRAHLDAAFSWTGHEHIVRSIAGGKGPLIVLSHLGGWEWAAFWITQVEGLGLTAVVEPVEPPELFDFFVELRGSMGVNVVPLGPSAGTEVIRAVNRGDVICLLTDRDIDGTGVVVDFFGERTTMPAGAATLALRTGAPLLPTAIYFDGRGHRAVVGPPVPAERRGRLREDVRRTTQDLADALEAVIRRAPEQWHLMQPNWPSDHELLARLDATPG